MEGGTKTILFWMWPLAAVWAFGVLAAEDRQARVHPLMEGAGIVRQEVTGHFIRPGHKETITLGVAFGAFETLEAFDAYGGGAFVPADPDQEMKAFDGAYLHVFHGNRRLMRLPNDAYSNDHAAFSGTCRDQSGRDLLMIELTSLGTVNADVNNTLVVHYDPVQDAFDHAHFQTRHIEGVCGLEAAEKQRVLDEARRAEAKAIIDGLSPPGGEFSPPTDNRWRKMPVRRIEDQELEDALRRLRQLALEEENVPGGQREDLMQYVDYGMETVTVEGGWRFAAAHRAVIWDSVGVMLAKRQGASYWTAFYRIPAGGSKVNLYVPWIEAVNGEKAVIGLCTSCSFWGDFERFELDLNAFSVRRAAKQ